MFWQLVIVGILVTAAAVYVLRKTWRTWHPAKGSCGGDCGCSSKATAEPRDNVKLIPTQELTLRRPPS